MRTLQFETRQQMIDRVSLAVAMTREPNRTRAPNGRTDLLRAKSRMLHAWSQDFGDREPRAQMEISGRLVGTGLVQSRANN